MCNSRVNVPLLPETTEFVLPLYFNLTVSLNIIAKGTSGTDSNPLFLHY